jgi:hypothetical protein
MIELLIAAAATAATPTLEVSARRVDAGGVRATYTRSVDADGTIHLIGTYEAKNRSPLGKTPFHYQVKGDKVVGKVGSYRTEFDHPRSR